MSNTQEPESKPARGAAGRILFIVNPAAGADRAQIRWTGFRSRLREAKIQFDEAFTSGPGHAGDLARAAARDYDLLVPVGGDGTVSEVAGAIVSEPGSRAVLAIVPFGTGNDMAQVLGIRNEAEAMRSLTCGRTRLIDVIEVDCQKEGKSVRQHALLFAGVGIISESLKQTTAACKRLFGQRLAYPVGLLRALLAYRSPHMRVTCDQEVLEQQFLFIGASNTEIAGGGMRLAPGARISDGLLNINLIGAMKRWAALKQLRQLCRGRHTQHPQVRYLTARSLRIEASSALEVAADGELIGHTPAMISVKPNCLPVLESSEKVGLG